MKRYSLLTGLVFTVLIFGFIQNIPFAHAAQGDLGSIIDTLEFDTLDGITPEIIQINGNTFAVVYESTDDDGTVAAFTISTTGDISNAILNTAVDFDTGIVSNPKIFHVTGTTYAIVYEENGSTIKFDTLTISNDGTITDLAPTSFTIGSATNPEVVELSGALGATKFYALTYRTNVGAGNVATFSVTANGLTVAQVTAGTEFTTTANDIKILKVASSQKYAAAYRDSSNKGQVEIITITDNGDTITPGNILLTLNSDTAISSTSKLDFAHVTGTTYAVLWADTADAKVQTITIPDNGASVTNIAISSAIDASGVPTDPVFLQTDLGVNPLNFIIAYHDTTAIKGELRSVTISTDGLTITNKDTIKFDNTSPSGQSPSLAHRTGDFYAVAYKGDGADGFIRSFNLGSADITPPVTTGARTITEVSDGNTADFSKLGDQVRLTFTADEVIQTPVVTFPTLGTVTVTYDNTSGNTWTATATIPSGATQGAVTFTLDFNDLAGNSATQVTTVSDTSSVTVDLTAPTTVATLIMGETASLNGDTDYSKTGDGVDTSLTANESLTGATITIGQETNTAMAGTNPSTGAWTDTYTLQAGDTEGTVTFSITATDRAGNQGTITQSLITDSSSVVFDKTAPTFTSAAITGNGDLNFVFSEPVLSTDVSHYVIEWPDGSVVTKTLAGSGTKTILADTAAVDAEGNDAVDFSISAGVTDRAGNALSPIVALANPRIAAASFTQPTLTSTNTDVVLSPNTLITTITATSVSPNVNLSGLTGGAGTATFPASSITVDTANADILFPAGVVASGLPTDEIIEVSVSTKTANAAILPAGEVAGIIIELGDPNTTITFDVPVKVTLTGQAGNTPFIVTSTPTTVLVSTCADGSATVAPTLGSTDPTNTASHCAIVDGANLIIWTRHFTGVGSSSTPSSSGGGGSAGDRTNPSVSTGFAQNEFPLKYDGVNYQSYQLNSVHTAIIENGEILRATLRVYENSGAGNVQHVELYLNQFGSQILNDLTETIVIYDKQSGLKIIDPHNLIYTATVTPSESGNKAVFDFVIVFENEIPESDLLFRIWDSKRNSMQFHLSDALIVKISEQSSGIISVEPESVEPESDSESILVTPKAIPKTSELTPEDELSTKTLIGEQLSVLKKWAGYDIESASDVDVLSKFGIKGEKIPPYVKHLVKWILEDKISTEDLVNALQYFKREGVLSNSVGVRSPDVNSKIVTENFTMDKEAVDTKTPFDEKKNNFHTVDNLGNFEDQIGILRSLANNPVIQNELTISNMEFKTFASPDDLITQRDSEWQRNSKTITPFMEGLMNNESALIAKALIERHKDDPVSLNHIAITNAYGVNVIITEKTLDYKQSDEQWWDKTKANGIYIMSGSGGEENLGLYDAKISLTINDAQGNFVGMLTAVVNFEKALLD